MIRNALSGFMVFLIALPLCLGIALASGFPPIAGILTAIVGGVLATPLGSAPLTIKGPAAGLIVIALGAVTELGHGDLALGYRRALAVGLVAALVQIALALFRADRLALVFPPSVVKGMLSAIGVIIVAKQAPIVMGVMDATGEPLHLLAHLPSFAAYANPAVVTIGLIAIVLLAVLPRIPIGWVRSIPAPMTVLVVSVLLANYLHLGADASLIVAGVTSDLGPEYLIQVPDSLRGAIVFPDFSLVTSAVSVKYIAMFAMVGTVESLLSVLAVDALDPSRHTSNLNRDLLATGVGNLVCAAIGGLPMISEIIRSKANIDAGATGRSANFFHGVFLLLAVALFPNLLRQIPLAALAAMLVVIGFRLASPAQVRNAWQVGIDQWVLFIATLVVTLATDLLVGVGCGLVLNLMINGLRNRSLTALFGSSLHISRKGGVLHVQVRGPLGFTNLIPLLRLLQQRVDSSVQQVLLDVSQATLVDHTAQERLAATANEWPQNTTLVWIGLESLTAISTYPTAVRYAAAPRS